MVLILLWRVWPFDLCHDAMREVVQVLVSFVEGKGLWLAVVGCLQDLGYPQKVDNFLSGCFDGPIWLTVLRSVISRHGYLFFSTNKVDC